MKNFTVIAVALILGGCGVDEQELTKTFDLHPWGLQFVLPKGMHVEAVTFRKEKGKRVGIFRIPNRAVIGFAVYDRDDTISVVERRQYGREVSMKLYTGISSFRHRNIHNGHHEAWSWRNKDVDVWVEEVVIGIATRHVATTAWRTEHADIFLFVASRNSDVYDNGEDDLKAVAREVLNSFRPLPMGTATAVGNRATHSDRDFVHH